MSKWNYCRSAAQRLKDEVKSEIATLDFVIGSYNKAAEKYKNTKSLSDRFVMIKHVETLCFLLSTMTTFELSFVEKKYKFDTDYDHKPSLVFKPTVPENGKKYIVETDSTDISNYVNHMLDSTGFLVNECLFKLLKIVR